MDTGSAASNASSNSGCVGASLPICFRIGPSGRNSRRMAGDTTPDGTRLRSTAAANVRSSPYPPDPVHVARSCIPDVVETASAGESAARSSWT